MAAMRVTVKVKPGAKKDEIRELEDGTLQVSVKAPPVDGKANEAVVALLASYFGIKQREIALVHGACARKKLFEIAANR